MPPCTGSKPYRSTSPTKRFSPARRRKWTQAPVLLKLVSNRASGFRYTLKRIYRAKGLFVTFVKIALKVKRLKLHRIKINSKNHPQSTHYKTAPKLNSLKTNTHNHPTPKQTPPLNSLQSSTHNHPTPKQHPN